MELTKGEPKQCYCGYWFALVSYEDYVKIMPTEKIVQKRRELLFKDNQGDNVWTGGFSSMYAESANIQNCDPK